MTESKLTNETFPWDLGGAGKYRDDLTVLQIGARAADLVFLTVMAQQASDLKLVPLQSVDPAVTPAYLTCGAIGGTAAEFAALTDAELAITVDGVEIILADMDMTGLDSVADTPGYMTCDAIGGTLPEFAAVADGQFGIALDGEAAIQIAAMDFSGVDAIDDTPGYWLCGTNGDTIGNWDALTDAAFSYVADGVAYDTGAMNLTLAVTFDGLINIINFHLNGHATMTYAYTVNKFQLVSNRTGETSSITIGAPAAGTDISAAGYLNQTAGAAVAGTGGENLAETPASIINAALAGRGLCYFNGDAFVFISRTAGEVSAVSALTAGTAGTDISGAGFLNGLAGTPTAGTGGEGLYESISEIINAAAAGRFIVEFNGDAFVFISPETGPVRSQITVLSDPASGGTDISTGAYLNGLVGTGVVTIATGSDGADRPAGILMSKDIAFALLVAGDVDDQALLVGSDKMIDEDKIVLENSLTLASVVVATGRTIRQHLEDMGIYPRKSQNDQLIQPIA